MRIQGFCGVWLLRVPLTECVSHPVPNDLGGQACEAFDYGGGGGTGGGGTGGGGTGTLANTGPQNKTLLPAGTALLVAGLALVGVTRYRARHARR